MGEAELTSSAEQLRVAIVVYVSAIVPLLLMAYLQAKRLLANWIFTVYIYSFITCALGWEIWFSYGLVEGDPVYLRRTDVLNTLIPYHLNWILNSLADAGSICLGGLVLVRLALGKRSNFLSQWSWAAFVIFLIWFIGQNIVVEMFLYHDQLAMGKPLSWAPFAPTGPWYNPVLFKYAERTISLQGQLPWLIMTPIFYLLLIRLSRHRVSSRLKR